MSMAGGMASSFDFSASYAALAFATLTTIESPVSAWSVSPMPQGYHSSCVVWQQQERTSRKKVPEDRPGSEPSPDWDGSHPAAVRGLHRDRTRPGSVSATNPHLDRKSVV